MARRYPRAGRGARCPTGQRAAAQAAAERSSAPDGAFNLEGFLRALDDGKLKHLQEEVERETRRRGWARKPPNPAGRAKPSIRRRATGRRSPPRVEPALTSGQARLVRAALDAGASPAAVAKELRLGRAQVMRLARSPKKGRPAHP